MSRASSFETYRRAAPWHPIADLVSIIVIYILVSWNTVSVSSSSSSTFWVGRIAFSHYWPSGAIRIGLPVWRWKRWNNFRMWEVQRAANGPVWMPQALKTLCLIHFWSWMNSLFPLLALWGNKNWPPSMKLEKLKKYGKKSGLMGCKWSNLNAPGTESPLSHPVLNLDEFSSPIIAHLG